MNSHRASQIETAPRQAGFTMLEVLISIIVVTMGLLGLAGMSIRSLAANDSSGLRATAATNAMYVADLMRANRQPVLDSEYDVMIGTASAPGPSPRAVADVTGWKTILSQMPSGDGSIAYDDATKAVRVVVRWNDKRGNMAASETATTQQYEYTFRP